MNTYRVIFKANGSPKRHYDVDACKPGEAIRRALINMTSPTTPDVDVSCRLYARNIQRHYSDPKVRAV